MTFQAEKSCVHLKIPERKGGELHEARTHYGELNSEMIYFCLKLRHTPNINVHTYTGFELSVRYIV